MDSFIEQVAKINTAINNVVWGVPMLILIIGTGILMTTLTKFFQITHAKHVTDETIAAIFKKKSVTKTKDKKAISQFQALSTALAATIGTGNIAGVGTAIAAGGPGAVFWMWLSAFFGMMTNYSENVLGIYYRKKNSKGEWSGGAMYYLENGLGSKKGMKQIAKALAVLFSLFCVLASFGIGNMTQVNSISSALESSFKIPPIVTGIILAIIAALVIVGGIKRIAQVTEKFVPFMAAAYIVGSLIILFTNISSIGPVFSAIFKGAFGMDAVAGGVVGTLVKKAVTMGFKRGVFSNEAGLGSSVMVHSASDVKEPVIQGMWGIFEVFFDTMVVCTLTAFTVLSSGAVDLSTGLMTTESEGTALIIEAFSTGIHGFAGGFVSVSILLFAFSTVLGWSFYGTKSWEYLFGERTTIIYKCAFVVFIVGGATLSLDLAWGIADTLNGLMAIPNLIGVIALSGVVVKITKNYVDRILKGKKIKPVLSAYESIQEEQEKAIK
ncbi:MAG: alanine/glycine:cation symporter family protein, partial [Clostridiaceae bacterium]